MRVHRLGITGAVTSLVFVAGVGIATTSPSAGDTSHLRVVVDQPYILRGVLHCTNVPWTLNRTPSTFIYVYWNGSEPAHDSFVFRIVGQATAKPSSLAVVPSAGDVGLAGSVSCLPTTSNAKGWITISAADLAFNDGQVGILVPRSSAALSTAYGSVMEAGFLSPSGTVDGFWYFALAKTSRTPLAHPAACQPGGGGGGSSAIWTFPMNLVSASQIFNGVSTPSSVKATTKLDPKDTATQGFPESSTVSVPNVPPGPSFTRLTQNLSSFTQTYVESASGSPTTQPLPPPATTSSTTSPTPTSSTPTSTTTTAPVNPSTVTLLRFNPEPKIDPAMALMSMAQRSLTFAKSGAPDCW